MKLATATTLLTLTLLAELWAPNAHAANIQNLDWITGHWTGSDHGQPMEAYYSNSGGDMILGVTKTIGFEKVEFFEFDTIVQDGEDIVLKPYPFGKKGVAFPLTELSAYRVVFENPNHEFPTRIIYELKRSGELVNRIEGTKGGRAKVEEFVLTRAK